MKNNNKRESLSMLLQLLQLEVSEDSELSKLDSENQHSYWTSNNFSSSYNWYYYVPVSICFWSRL